MDEKILNSTPVAEQDPAEREKIKGVFSSQEVKKVGTGTTTRKTIQKAFWYAEENEDGSITMQPLNLNYVPSGPKHNITLDNFLSTFSPEMEFYIATVFPRMRELNKTILRAERHRKNGEHFSAEYEFGNALKVDEENVRANFGLGLTYLDRGQADKANDLFQRIVKLDAAFEQEHKHLFNEFGINLRKNKMHDQSIEYYGKALDLSKTDENLFCNLARAFFDAGNYTQAVENLIKSLEINPEHEVAVKFLNWMQDKEFIPPTQLAAAQAALGRGPAPESNVAPDPAKAQS